MAVVLAGCNLFAPRTPEDPVGEAGTYFQPVAPDLVVDNLRAAVAELNAANYRRSLDQELDFTPTALAQARDPSLWASWGHAEENSYFTTVTEAAKQRSGHVLRLEGANTELSDTRYTLDAHYVLVLKHGRPPVPDTLQGRLIWEITQNADGLWYLREWTDQAVAGALSWSDLKAEFGK